jgi:hypothetical protein
MSGKNAIDTGASSVNGDNRTSEGGKVSLERALEREREKNKMLSRALHRHASSILVNGKNGARCVSGIGIGDVGDLADGSSSENEYASIEELDNAALKLAPRLSAFRATVAGDFDGKLAPERQELLENYQL